MATSWKCFLRPCTWNVRRYLVITRQTRSLSRLEPDEKKSRIKLSKNGDRGGETKTNLREKNAFNRSTPKVKRLTDTHEYEILSADDPRLGRTILQMKSKKGRLENKEIVIEGGNHIIDALRANGVIKAFYFSNSDLLQRFPLSLLPPNIPLYKVPNFKLNLFTDLASSPGILGIFKMPPEDKALCPAQRQLPITLVCEGIQDPAVLGNLLQTAAAVGCERVILMKGCCDHWSSKVLRSSAMSQFHLRLLTNFSWSKMQSTLQTDQPLKVYSIKKERIQTGTMQQDGLGQSVLDNQMLQRDNGQMIDQDIDYQSDEENSDEESSDEETGLPDGSDNDEEKQDNKPQNIVDQLYYDTDHLREYKKLPITMRCFDNVDFTFGRSVVIVGEANSLQSKKFLYDNGGQVLHFPIASQIYGLTAATAAGLVLFEADKQSRKSGQSS